MRGDVALLSVVVPSYRQEATITGNVTEIVRRVAGIGVPFEVIVVSDGSPDGTASIARAIDDPRVRVVSYDRNMGKGYALRTGSLAARGDWIAWVDSDLDLDPLLLDGFLSRARADNLDVVVGSKRHPESVVSYPARRRVYSWLYQQLVRVLFSLDVRDTQVGMKLFRREVLDEVLPVVVVKRYAFDLEILAVANRFGFGRIAEASIRLDYGFTGSGVNWRAIVQALWDTAAVYYRLRLLRFYDRRRVLSRRLNLHRLGVLPTVTVLVTPGRLHGEVPAEPPPGVPGFTPVRTEPGEDLTQSLARHVRAATTDLVAVIDGDSHPTRHWMDAALPLFGDPLIGAVAGPTVANLDGDDLHDAAGVLAESRIGLATARVRHHVGSLQEVGEFPLRNVFVRTELALRMLDAGVPLDDAFCAEMMRREGASVLCSPDVVVATSPAPLIRPHLAHLFEVAHLRGLAPRRAGGFRPRHSAPVMFVVAAASAPIVLRHRHLRRAWVALATIYSVSIIGYTALITLIHRRPRMAALAGLGAVLSHVTYGCGVLVGVAERAARVVSRR